MRAEEPLNETTPFRFLLALSAAWALTLSLLGAYAWRQQRTAMLEREAAAALRAVAAAAQAAELPSARRAIEGIEVSHPTTAPRDRLIVAIAEAERGEAVCAPLVIQSHRANWFHPTQIDELSVLVLVSDSIKSPVVEWRRKGADVDSPPRQFLARPSRNPQREGVAFLLFKELFAAGLTAVTSDQIVRPEGEEWLKEDDSEPYNDFSKIEVRVRRSPETKGGVWWPVESMNEELSARVSAQGQEQQLRLKQRYPRPRN
jgi:hypothetical protein